nr:hypothetical protein [uncultured Shimia sp.]
MKLNITKDQKEIKGLGGKTKGVQFSLSAIVDLDATENQLCAKYVLMDEILCHWTRPSDAVEKQIKAGELLTGLKVETTKIRDVLSLESSLIEAAKALDYHINAAAAFRGKESIQISEPEQLA